MFNTSQKMEEDVEKTIEDMVAKERTHEPIRGSKTFFVSTERNKKDLLLGKIKKGNKNYYLYQKNPL